MKKCRIYYIIFYKLNHFQVKKWSDFESRYATYVSFTNDKILKLLTKTINLNVSSMITKLKC